MAKIKLADALARWWQVLETPKKLLLPFILCLATVSNILAAPLPMSGVQVDELSVFETAMQDYMQQNDISAGVVALMKNGVPIYRRAFGWQNAEKTVPLRHDSIFRLASVTKPLTAAVIRNLIADGSLNLNDRVFDIDFPFLLPGLLEHEPFGTPDPRLLGITVDHLLRHRGGWNRQIAGPGDNYLDLTYQEENIAAEMGVSSPPGRDVTVESTVPSTRRRRWTSSTCSASS